ncbi:MAG TPA: FtsW/RodA/SpoVE family cell cycle protein [Firmicutes bacterium]|nr:FtsW/RodA/SpoVE family cell cycle protein [Bacillota bacterium]
MSKIFGKIADYIRETDKQFFILCIAASLYGSLLVLSASRAIGQTRQFFVQLLGIAIGIIAAIIISNFDYKTFGKRWYIIAGLCIFLFVFTYFFGYTPSGTDNKAWIELPGGMSLQPSEIIKVCFIITFAYHVYRLGDNVSKLTNVLLLCVHGAVPILLVHFLQGDDGTALMFAGIFLFMMFAAGIKLRYFLITGGAALAAAPFAWFFVLSDYQRSRILSIFNPAADIQGIGYQQYYGGISIGSGGLAGYGLFNGPSVQNGTVPKAYNDFIFTVAGEELGFLGCLAIILLISAICIRALRVSYMARDKMGSMICVGVFAMIAVQSMVNIGMCLSLLPVIGITLPFFSAGGTSVVALYLGVGLVLSVYMHKNKRVLYLKDE